MSKPFLKSYGGQILVALASLMVHHNSVSQAHGDDGPGMPVSADDAKTQPAQSQPASSLSEIQKQKIEKLIAGLRWSGTIGSGHGPPLQIPGNDNDQELVRIGKPSVPFLLQALAPVQESNVLAKRRNVVAVRLLGDIGDPSAVDGILKAMDQQWKDSIFLREAISSLKKLGDERAIPALDEVSQLSLDLYMSNLSGIAVPANAGPASSRFQWWTTYKHISSVDMSLLWTDACIAIGSISPSKAMELARSARRKGGETQYLRAAILAQSASEKEAKHTQEALSLCEEAYKHAQQPLGRQVLNLIVRDLKQRSNDTQPAW